ncbi:MAG: hypothetical protein ABSA54_14965 [Terriglobales bacterium]|jgi:hypothetical protein
MFERLSKKLSGVQCRTLLGRTARLRARQIRESIPTLSEPEAEEVASREAVASLRGEGIDATSLAQVTAWSNRFLASTTSRPQNTPRQEWGDVPKDCDLVMTANQIRDMLRMTEQEAAAKGEAAYYKKEFLEVLHPFVESPSLATATPLLQVAPFLRPYFEKCSPGGEFYEMRRFLNGR